MQSKRAFYVAMIVLAFCAAAAAQNQSNQTFHTSGNQGFIQDCSNGASCNVVSVATDTQVGQGGATTGFLYYAMTAPDGTVYFGMGNMTINAFSGDGNQMLSFDFNTAVDTFDNFIFYPDGSFSLGPGGWVHVTWTKTDVYAGSSAGNSTNTTPHSKYQKNGNSTFNSAHGSGTVLGFTIDSYSAQMGTERNTTIYVQISH